MRLIYNYKLDENNKFTHKEVSYKVGSRPIIPQKGNLIKQGEKLFYVYEVVFNEVPANPDQQSDIEYESVTLYLSSTIDNH